MYAAMTRRQYNVRRATSLRIQSTSASLARGHIATAAGVQETEKQIAARDVRWMLEEMLGITLAVQRTSIRSSPFSALLLLRERFFFQLCIAIFQPNDVQERFLPKKMAFFNDSQLRNETIQGLWFSLLLNVSNMCFAMRPDLLQNTCFSH